MSKRRFPNIFKRRLSVIPKRTVAILTGVIVVASGASAYAVTRGNASPRQALLNDMASRLHVSAQQLTSAYKSALIDRIQAAVAAGRLTQARANAIERRIEQAQTPPFFGRPGGLHHFMGRRHALIESAAGYLGLTPRQLSTQLRSGQSLAQIATAHGKSASGLQSTLIDAIKKRLASAVSSGTITSTQEQRILSRVSARIERLINRKGLGRDGAGDARPPGDPQLGFGPPAGPPPGAGSGASLGSVGPSGSDGQPPPAY